MEEMAERAHAHHVDPVVEYQSSKFGMWLFIATELLLFGGLFTAYTIYRAKYPEMFHEQHLELNKPIGAINTVILICSSLTMALGVASIKRGKQELLRLFLSLTILFGIMFLINKYFEWGHEFRDGNYPGTSIFFSLYFMMTGLHMIHVIVGLLVLAVMLAWSFTGRFSDKYNTPIELGGIYWHLVDLIWIYLFPLLYLIG
jgi:cytochrome c oxidase subunit 3